MAETAVEPTLPIVLSAVEDKLIPLPPPISHSVASETSAMMRPVARLQPAKKVRAAQEAMIPEGAVTAGRARMPAPTVVPATRREALKTEPGECLRVVGSTLLKRRGDGDGVGDCEALVFKLIFGFVVERFLMVVLDVIMGHLGSK